MFKYNRPAIITKYLQKVIAESLVCQRILALGWHGMIVGGTLRQLARLARYLPPKPDSDVLETASEKYHIRDLDIVIENVDPLDIPANFFDLDFHLNSFGGYKFEPQNSRHVSTDMWRVADTWAVKKGLAIGREPLDVLKSVTFNVDVIAATIEAKPLLFGQGFFQAMDTGVLDIHFLPAPSPLAAVSRAIHFAELYELRFSPQLRRFAQSTIRRFGPEAIERAYFKQYGRILDSDVLKEYK